MKIDLGVDSWRLIVRAGANEAGYQHTTLTVEPIEDPDKERFWGDGKPNTDPALTARQRADGTFIGRIALEELRLFDTGFQATGIALEEKGTTYLNGAFQRQRWFAEHVPNKAE